MLSWMTIGDRVKELRERRRLNPTELAGLVGVTDSAISQLEAGITKAPSFSTGVRLARALGVSPWEIAFGEPEPPLVVGAVDIRMAPPQIRGAGTVTPPAAAETESRSTQAAPPDLIEVSRDLKALTKEVKRLRKLVEPSVPRARRSGAK